MKRNENLKTLSWEHHDGLVTAFRLQQGIKNKISVNILKKYILHIWDKALQHHFWQEEQVILTLKEKSKDGKAVVDKMMDDHKIFRELIDQLKKEKISIKQISDFENILNQHIRFEERQLFPFIESNLSQEELVEIGVFLRQNHSPANHDWKQKFW